MYTYAILCTNVQDRNDVTSIREPSIHIDHADDTVPDKNIDEDKVRTYV